MKIELSSDALHRILSDASQFSASGVNVPAIESVRLESATGAGDTVSVVAVATDRFTLGASHTVAEGDTGLAVTLASVDVKNVLRIAKTAKRDSGWRRVTVSHEDDTVTFVFSSGESVAVRVADADFPSWRRLLSVDSESLGRPAAGLGLDPIKLAQFSRVSAAKTSPMQIFPAVGPAGANGEPGLLKPVHVRIGEDFYGLVMPVRSPAGGLFSYEMPGWLS